MKQQCTLSSVWLTWLALPVLVGLAYVFFGWPAALAVAVAAVAWQMVYIRLFPRLSTLMGYGSVADVAAPVDSAQRFATLAVTLYTASPCPFCPLVRTRLTALQEQLGFSLTELDVTLRPATVSAKGIKAVPAVEVNGLLHAGNLTSAELVQLMTLAASAAA